MRIVFDTNVLFSAFVTHGACAALYEECLEHAEVVVSRDILRELDKTLRAKAGFTMAETRDILQALHADAMVAQPAPLSKRVCRVPNDDRILGAALGADADVIATGDKDILDLKRFQRIPILTPRECLIFITKNL